MPPTLYLPAKTFLIGEYAVLQGAPAIAVATTPCFEITYRNTKPTHAFHPDSPAGQLSQQHPPAVHIDIAPQKHPGGLGQSSAEFLAVWAANPHNMTTIDIETILTTFWSCTSGLATRPSGMDIATQYFGQCTFFDGQQYQAMPWPFETLMLGLWHTGRKLATHTHLQSLHTPPHALTTLAQQALTAMLNQNDMAFVNHVRAYQSALAHAGLQAETTAKYCQHLMTHPNILACKGCGAMGADVILALFHPEHQDAVCAHVAQIGLAPIYIGQKLAPGMVSQRQSIARQFDNM